MIVFSAPKAMTPPFDVIQRNAAGSWARLKGSPRVHLFGSEQGVDGLAQTTGATHDPGVRTNEFGTPVLDDMFERARADAENEPLLFVNADVVLLDDIMGAAEAAINWGGRFLLVGRRTTVDVGEIDFEERWESVVRQKARGGTLDPVDHMDYFLFSSDLFRRIPSFAIGRPPYDQWLIWRALRDRAAVIDATDVVTAVHQRHDYSHVVGGKAAAYEGEEARRNTDLAGGWTRMLSLRDCTHVIGRDLQIHRAPIRRRAASVAERVRRKLIDTSRPLRHPFGIRQGSR